MKDGIFDQVNIWLLVILDSKFLQNVEKHLFDSDFFEWQAYCCMILSAKSSRGHRILSLVKHLFRSKWGTNTMPSGTFCTQNHFANPLHILHTSCKHTYPSSYRKMLKRSLFSYPSSILIQSFAFLISRRIFGIKYFTSPCWNFVITDILARPWPFSKSTGEHTPATNHITDFPEECQSR